MPVPGPVMPAGDEPAGALGDAGGGSALSEALPADGTFAGEVEGVETSEIGTFVVNSVVRVVSREPVPETMTTGVVTIVLRSGVGEEGFVIGAAVGAPD